MSAGAVPTTNNHGHNDFGRPSCRPKHYSLSDQDHLLDINKLACLQAVKVNTAGVIAGVERRRLVARHLDVINKRCCLLPENIINLEAYNGILRQFILNDRRRIEWIRIILMERERLRQIDRADFEDHLLER